MPTLTAERLEIRDTPAVLYDPAMFPGDPPPIPGWTGPTYYTLGHWDANVTLDMIAVAGPGGGPVVVVRSGGTGQWVEEWDPVLGPVQAPEGYGDVLFSGMVFPEAANERIGLGDVVMTDRGRGEPGVVYATWDAGGGPVVWQYDPATGEGREFLAAEPEYRGGLSLTFGTVYLANLDTERPVNSDLIVTTNPGGGPVVRAFDSEGNQIASVMAGDPASRDGVTLSPALVGVQVDPAADEYGFATDNLDGSVSLWTWGGRLVSTTRDGDPGTQWRL